MQKRRRKPRRRLKPIGWVALAALLLVVVLSGFGVRNAVMKSLYPVRYDEFVETYTSTYHLEKSFVYAVIKCESSFNPNAVSNVGARGLMQIMPETYRWLQSKTGETNDDDTLFDPETSIRYGCMMYEILLRQFSDERVAVCAYHAGMGNVEKWLRDPQYSDDGKTLKEIPFPSTAQYADRVMRVREIYQSLYHL